MAMRLSKESCVGKGEDKRHSHGETRRKYRTGQAVSRVNEERDVL